MAVKKRKVSKKTYQDAKAYYTHGGAAYDIEPIEEEYAPHKKQIKKQKRLMKMTRIVRTPRRTEEQRAQM